MQYWNHSNAMVLQTSSTSSSGGGTDIASRMRGIATISPRPHTSKTDLPLRLPTTMGNGHDRNRAASSSLRRIGPDS